MGSVEEWQHKHAVLKAERDKLVEVSNNLRVQISILSKRVEQRNQQAVDASHRDKLHALKTHYQEPNEDDLDAEPAHDIQPPS